MLELLERFLDNLLGAIFKDRSGYRSIVPPFCATIQKILDELYCSRTVLYVCIFSILFQVQPFMTGSENDFGKAELCEADLRPNNIVPIAVGAALAALVVIVLVMYLIGRRRHQRGYQTV